ncbi:MAG: mitochondrial fission ELM1 family protein [Hyphomonadaceae bacterium]|nr:mitochondrial fission ELM1 family protein [Hyphomonadaceae bacterium]
MRQAGFQGAEPLTVWAVTDGRAGIENQALGLAEAIARKAPATITTKRIALRSPWRWLPAGLIPTPRAQLSIASDAIDPPWPDIWIGCGRASVALSMGVRAWSRGKTFVVQLQDPKVNPREFDLVAPPKHDGLEGPNVLPIIGSCHRVTPEKIAAEVEAFDFGFHELSRPRFALLIGGKSKRQDITPKRARLIANVISALRSATNGTILCSLSRRTGDAARAVFAAHLAPHCAVYYEGEGRNPYFAMLEAADAIFVTADSVNMAAEAAATSKPVHILAVDGSAGKIARFHESLRARGCARPFRLPLEFWGYPPLLEADRVAAVVLNALAARHGASGRDIAR